MVAALAFYLWSQIQLLTVETVHFVHSSGQTVVGKYYGFDSHEVAVGQCDIRYFEQGHGPTLVLIHGAGVSKEVWLPIIPYLSKQYHLVIPDMPGHGQSCRDLERDYTVQGISQWLSAFLDRLHLGHVHLVGHSIGGSTVAWLAGEQPERVASLTLIAPAGIEQVPTDFNQLTPFMQELVQTGRNRLLIEQAGEYFDKVVKLVMHKVPWLPWGAYRFLAWEHMRDAPQLDKVIAGVLKTREQIQSGEESLEQRVRSIKAPVQVLWGEKDQMMHVSGAQVFEELRPDIKIYRLADIGHGPMIEVPQKVAELVEALIPVVPEE